MKIRQILNNIYSHKEGISTALLAIKSEIEKLTPYEIPGTYIQAFDKDDVLKLFEERECEHKWKHIHTYTYVTPQFATYRCEKCGIEKDFDEEPK